MNVVLTGFMGTGKSTVGRRLARRLGLTFIDLDSIIEKEAGASIKQIFAAEGEDGFRNREAAVIGNLVTGVYGNGFVVATGGGAVLREINRKNLRGWGAVVCLRASAEEILRRVGSAEARPLLAVEDKLKVVTELMAGRTEYYSDCDFSLDTTGLRADEAVNCIVDFLDKRRHGVVQ